MAIFCRVLKKDLILKMLYNHTDILLDNQDKINTWHCLDCESTEHI